jgi:hypothetical protein
MLIDMPLAPGLETIEEILFDTPNLAPLRSFHPLVRIPLISFQAADLVATELAIRTIEAGGVGAIDLYTPEIRRYEETALVGMGGMII